jgi:hypothetical protein
VGQAFLGPLSTSAQCKGGKWQISNGGGSWVNWSQNGHDVLYDSGDQIMAASYTVKGDTLVPEKPRVSLPPTRTARKTSTGA